MATLTDFRLPSAVWRFLAEHKRGILPILARFANLGADGFNVAEALYYLAANYGGSEFCPLRRAENSTGFRPGLMAQTRNEPEPGTMSREIYDRLAEFLSR